MDNLPKWGITNINPALNDAESKTAIEQTAKVYGAMQKLIETYNAFEIALNKAFNDFSRENTAESMQFKRCVTETAENFIKTVDMKLSEFSRRLKTYEENGGAAFDLTTMQEDIDTLETALDTIQSEIDRLKNSSGTGGGSVDLTAIEEDLQAIKGEGFDELTNVNLVGLNKRVSDNFLSINTNVLPRIKDNKQDIQALQNDVDGLKNSAGTGGGKLYLHKLNFTMYEVSYEIWFMSSLNRDYNNLDEFIALHDLKNVPVVKSGSTLGGSENIHNIAIIRPISAIGYIRYYLRERPTSNMSIGNEMDVLYSEFTDVTFTMSNEI